MQQIRNIVMAKLIDPKNRMKTMNINSEVKHKTTRDKI